jgi:flagellar hook-basal body complex protein FliE
MLPIGSVDISSLIGSAERLPGAKNAAAIDPETLAQAVGEATSLVPGTGTGVAPLTAAGATPATAIGTAGAQGPSFSQVLQDAVQEVDTKMKVADTEKAKLLTGETGNVHQAMIAVQESNVAFSLMVEVRNKLVDSYQELMRMQV